jgi:hypothetical protein
MKATYCMALLLSLAGAAAADWRVDSTPIAWADAAEPANGVSARLQVECSQDRRIISLVVSDELPPERIGVSFRFDRGPVEHRISPVVNLHTVTLLNVSSDRLARGKRFRIVLHPIGIEPLFYEFDLTGSGAAISAVPCKRRPRQ